MARSCNSGSLDTRVRAVAVAVAACFGVSSAQHTYANPALPQVMSGAARFTQTGNLLTVTNSPSAIINWGSFSIGANEITRFVQQSASSAVLNRVVGQDPSVILGSLQSNGRVLLINPNGIVFGAGSQINVAGLVASTLNLSNEDFLSGRMRFGDALGKSLLNQGAITTPQGGSVYLVGSAVTNGGIINSPKGEVILAAGNRVELVNPGTPDLRVEVVAPDNQAINLGEIAAQSGRIGIHAGLIRNTGVINANSVEMDAAGRIVLRARADARIEAGSRLSANGTNGANGGAIEIQSGGTTLTEVARIEATAATGVGGTVKVLGNRVGLMNDTRIDVSGATGGGTLLAGGSFQGKSAEVQNAVQTHVSPGVTLKADAHVNGDGGTVIVWADDNTRFYGSISARGGARAGNGGFVEVSGKETLVFKGKVDTQAPFGNGGMLLLDPVNVAITGGTGDGDDAGAANNSFAGSPSGVTGTVALADVTPTQIFQSELQGIAATTSISINASNNITFGGAFGAGLALLQTAPRTVTFNAGNTLALGGTKISTAGASLTLKAGAGGITGLGSLATGAGAINLTTGAALTQTAATSIVSSGVTTITAGAGNDVTLNNAGNNFGTVTVASGNNVTLQDSNALVLGASAIAGKLNVTTAGAITQSAALSVTGAASFTAGANVITLANAANDFAGAVSLVNSGAKNVAITDKNALTLGASSLGSGTLTVTAAGAITQTGALVQSGAGNVTITAGAANAITLGDATNDFVGPVRIVSGKNVTLADKNAFAFGAGGTSAISGNLALTTAGAITQANAVTVTGTASFNAGANPITLTNAANNFTGAVSLTNSGANNVAITDANAIVLGASTVGQNLAITANGAITQTGALVQSGAGTVTITAGAANAIALGDAANDFLGPVRIVSGKNVTLADKNAFSFGAGGTSAISGSLSLTTAGAITQANALTVTGTAGFSAGANPITLTNAANNFTGAVSASNSGANAIQITDVNAIVLGAISTADNLTVTGVGITQNASGLTAGGASAFNGGAGVVTLTAATNDFTGAVSLANSGANAIQVTDKNAIQLGTVTTANNLTANAVGITQSAAALTVGGASTFNAGAGVVTLTTATNDFTGAVSLTNSGANAIQVTDKNAIQLGTVTTANNLTVNAVGITQGAAALTVGGASTFNAGAGVVTLATATNDFTGAVSVTNSGANAIQITDKNAIQLGTVTTANNLTVNAVGITQGAAALTIGGASTFNAGAGVVTLTAAANDFTGAVSAANSGANAIQITDKNAIQLGTVTTANNLTVNAVGITQGAAALTVGGASTFNAGAGVVTLATATNDFTGAVSAANSGANAIQITDKNAIQLGTVTTANNLTVTAVGITQSAAALTVAGTSSFNAGAGAITLTTATNNFTGAVSLNNSGANNVSVTDANAIVLGASSVGSGTLTVTATGANTITQTGAITQAPGAGVASFSAGGAAITLTQANDFTGAVAAANTGAFGIQITDANALQLGTITTANTLTLKASGSVTQSGVVTANTLTAALTGAASQLNLGSAANKVTTIGAVTAPGGMTLTNGNNPTTAGGLINTSGGNGAVAISTGTGAYTHNNFDITSGSGPITVTADAVAIAANTGNNAFQTTGVLTLRPSTAATAMSLAGAAAFDLTAAEVTALSGGVTGAGSIVIGDAAASTGVMTVGAAVNFGAKTVSLNAGSFTDGNTTGRTITTQTLNLLARNAGGGIGAAGANNAIDVAVTNLTFNTNNGGAFINSTGAVNFGAGTSNVGTGAISVVSAGAMTQSGAITQAAGAGAAAFNAGANAITLTNAANDFRGAVSLNTSGANNAAVTDVNAIDLGASSVGGNLTINAGAAVTDGGAVSAKLLTVNSVTGAVLDFGHTVGSFSATNTASGNVVLNDAGGVVITGISNIPGNVTLKNNGAVTQSGAISATGLELLGAGGGYTLTNTANSVATLAANTGSVSYVNAGALSIGTVNTAGITATGLIDVRTQSGNLTLSNAIATASVSANAVTLVADVPATPDATGTGGNFINAGAATIITGAGGAWRIYSGSPTGTTRGGLVEAGKRYNVDEAGDPLAAGNRLYFRIQPVLTLTADDKAKTYGDANPAFTFSLAGLIDGDTQGTAISSAPAFSVDGTVSTSGNLTAATPHNIIPSGATSGLGYSINPVNGSLTVNKLALTGAAIANVTTTYGTAAATGAVSFGNVVGADVVTPATATIASPVNSTSGNWLRARLSKA